MAAGLIMVAHKSGGPLLDIVVESPEAQRNGYLAKEEEEYAKVIKDILTMSPAKQGEIRKRARSSVDRFSDQEFSRKFKQGLAVLLND